MNEKLKSCPFCGGRAELFGNEDSKGFYVKCLHCEAVDVFHSLEEAIAAWNKRPFEDMVRSVMKKLSKDVRRETIEEVRAMLQRLEQ